MTTRNSVSGEARDGEVGLDAAVGVQPLRVDDAAGLDGDVVGADALQHGFGIGALDADLAERRHVEQGDAGAHGGVLGGGVVEPVLALPAVAVFGLLALGAGALGQIPERALPAGGLAEAGAARFQPLVERRVAHAARGLVVAIGEVVGVEQAERLGDAIDKVGLVALEREHAADVDAHQVHGGLAGMHPFGQRLAGAAGGLDADGVEAGGDEEVLQLGRLAEQIAVVGREAFGAVEEGVDAGARQDRQARHGLLQLRRDVIPVVGQGEEFGVVGDAVDAPGLRPGLEEADEQLAGILLGVGALVGHAQHRQVARDVGVGVGDDVEVLARHQRHVHAGHAADIAAPQAGAVDDVVGADRALVGGDAGGAALLREDAGDLGVLEDAHAVHARALGQRLRDVGGIGLAVGRDEDAADHILEVDQRMARLRVLRRQHVHVDAEGPRHGGLPLQLLEALVR